MFKRLLLTTAALLSAAATVSAAGPVAVSPGAEERFLGVASACPTFSWTGVDGATGYELVVYAMPGVEEGAAGIAAPALDVAPAIRATVPAGARSWTPPSESCLALAGEYAWSVRALGETEAGEWSDSKLFKVDAGAVVAGIAGALERALGRYLDERGIRLEPDGGLAALVVEELAGSRAAPSETIRPGERVRYSGGKRLVPGEPTPRGVFSDDVELWLEETGSGSSDKVQLVFATPEFDGNPADAWAIIVEAEDSLDPDDGKMFISTPTFFDALQLFTDGTAIIGDLRELRILPSTSPPVACTSALLQGGMLYWDSTIQALCACDGTSWKPVDADETGSCV